MVRKSLFWIHLVTGLVAALPLTIMALTGIVLSFEHQIVDSANRDARVVARSEARRLLLDSLVARAMGEEAAKITAIAVEADPLRSVEVRQGREGKRRVDPWTGEVKTQGASMEAAFALVERVHRWLGSREIGGKVTGVSVLLCLVLSCTGLVLWWPRKVAALRQVVWPRRGLQGKARDWQWHNSIGVLVLPMFVWLCLTGTVMSWKWAESLLYRVAGPETPRRPEPPKAGSAVRERKADSFPRSWQTWMDTALAHAPAGWTSVVLTAPQKPGAGAMAQFRTTAQRVPSGGAVTMNSDGRFESWTPARSDRGARWRMLVKPLHTGELFGWAGQAAMAMASGGVLILVWTGLSLAWRRVGLWFRSSPLNVAGKRTGKSSDRY